MTLIQCFSQDLLDNLAGFLRLRPDRLILLGDPSAMEQPARQYRAIAQARRIPMEVSLRPIQGKRPNEAAVILQDILRREKDCVIDLTGSDESVSLAVGAVLAEMPEQKIPVLRYDWKKNIHIGCDGKALPGQEAWITVPELIALHGGTIHPDTCQPVDGAVSRDLDALWAIAAEDPRAWNRKIATLREFESRSFTEEEIWLPLGELERSIKDYPEKEARLQAFLKQLQQGGIIWNRSGKDHLHYGYHSALLRCCTEKAGNVLEVKSLLEAMALQDGTGSFFHDGRMSVSIDWDGIIHDPEKRIPETRNEIDIVLIRGLTPLFLSCKNGRIGDEELYKLHTVASGFGGPHARKMLIAANLDQGGPTADRAFIQRARDMEVFLVTDAAKLDRPGWEKVFRCAMEQR